MDVALFREHFPEFADATKYPPGQITFWSGIGIEMLNADRWGDLYDHGLELWTAHHIVLATKNVNSAAAGGDPGVDTATISSMSAGSVSASFDNQASLENEGGEFNTTSYGRQYLRLARIVGIGGAVAL